MNTATFEKDCVIAEAFVRKSGKTGFGLAIQLKSRGDCAVTLGRATLTLHGQAPVVGNPGLAPQRLRGRSLIYAWLPIEFDNNAAWNAEQTTGTVDVAVTVGAAVSTWRIFVVEDLL